MAGKKDIVEQALKLVAGAGEQSAPKLSQANLEDFIKTHFPDASPNYSASNTDKYGPSSSIYYYIPSENGNKTIRLSDHDLGAREGVDLRYGEDLDTAKYKILKNFGVLSDEDLLKMFPKQIENEKINQLNSWQQMFDEHVNWVNNTKKKSERQTLIDEYLKTHPKPTFNSGGSVREGYGPGGIIDDVVRLAGKVISGEGDEAAQAGIRAYHGSPHDFDKFDMSKIGTGEGAQAYGHGLYKTQTPDIGRGYRDSIMAAQGIDPEMKIGKTPINDFYGSMEQRLARMPSKQAEEGYNQLALLEDLAYGGDVLYIREKAAQGAYSPQTMDWFEKSIAPHFSRKGRLYEVDINADPNTFLDWDKPLSEQPEAVKNALTSFGVIKNIDKMKSRAEVLRQAGQNDDANEIEASLPHYEKMLSQTGDELHQRMFHEVRHELGGQGGAGAYGARVAERLREAGIPGIKYLDAGSRGAGDGTRNYVVFDDKLISIIRKYGIAGASAMLGYNLMENLDANQARAATAADMDYQKNRPQKSEGGARTEDPYAEEIATAKALMAAKAYEDQPWSEWAADVAQNAVNTAKSILPTALGGRGEVGISDIARGAYEAGKDAVTFPGDVISGKQALFDARGRPLESAVGRSFNAASTLGGASSVVPRPSNSLGVFGGIKSLTADKPAIRKAMAMESKGANRDDIWTETGWGRGADTFWRYEIPDTGSTVDSSALEFDLSTPSTRRAKLGDYLQHPEFFAAYPQFKNMEVSTFPTNSNYQGMYYQRYDRGTINPGISEPYITLNGDLLSSGAAQRSTLLHELQHAVQQKEGFAPGTNISAQASGRTNPAVERYENAVKNDPEMKELMSIRSSMDYKKDIDAANEIYTVEYRPAEYEIDRMNIPKEEKNAKYDALMADYDKRVNGMFPNLGRVKELENNIRAKNIPLYYPRRKILTPMESYLQYSGEIEARNVQDRRDWERGKLRAIPPWNTQDYPFEDHLFPENDVTWKFGYADGGEVDDDVNDALRIAKDVGGGTPVMMEDAKGNKYDAQGNIIPQDNTGPNPQRTEEAPQQNVMFNTAPQNYSQDVQPFIDYAVTPIDRPGMPSEPDLVNVMRIATQVAAQGQPTDDRGERNFARRRSETVRSLAGASPEGYQSDYKGPFTYNAGDTADFLNTLIDFSPYGALEYAHDIPYEAGRTGDYGTAAVEGGLGALMTTPGMALAGRGIKKGYELAKQFPKLTAGAIGAGAATTGSDEAEAGPARWFSKAVEVARAIPMNKMTGEQALAMLRKGTSPEELRWMGAEDFLSGQKSVSKDDLVAFLEKNRVQPTEITLGGNKPFRRDDVVPSESAIASMKNRWDELTAKNREITNQIMLPPSERRAPGYQLAEEQIAISDEMDTLHAKMIDDTIAEMGGLGTPPKFQTHSTSGGQGYEETLITLPNLPGTKPVEYQVFGAFPGTFKTREEAERHIKGIQEIEKAMPAFSQDIKKYPPRIEEIYEKPEFWEGHWDRSDVLAHVRSQILDVTPPGANRPFKGWNADEFQSKWGQEGRDLGFAKEIDPQIVHQLSEKRTELMFRHEAEREKFIKAYEAIQDEKIKDAYKNAPTQWDLPNALKQAQEARRKPHEAKFKEYKSNFLRQQDEFTPDQESILQDAFDSELEARIAYEDALKTEKEYKTTSGISRAPYVTSTEGWTDLSIKKSLDKAIDSGSDYFTWTPGEVHAKRYNLRSVVDEIQYDPKHRILFGRKDGKKVFEKDAVKSDELGKYVGKEMASKLLSQPTRESKWYANPRHVLSDEELEIGGEGMINYYDKIVPKRVEEVIRKATGKKPKIEIITVQTANGPRQQFGVRIDEDLRNARFSDFKKGGRVTGGNTYDNDDSVAHALALTSEY